MNNVDAIKSARKVHFEKNKRKIRKYPRNQDHSGY